MITLQTIVSILLPIFAYILAGYYASNEKWCDRKIIVAVITGLVIGGYALVSGIDVSDSWVQVAFSSAPVLGGINLVDRLVKGFAKRYGIDWLYADECEAENES